MNSRVFVAVVIVHIAVVKLLGLFLGKLYKFPRSPCLERSSTIGDMKRKRGGHWS